MADFYAHSLSDRSEADWDPLDQHLRRTSDVAEAFSEIYAPGWRRIAGQLHDAGKYLARFQKRIRVNPAHRIVSAVSPRGMPVFSALRAEHTQH